MESLKSEKCQCHNEFQCVRRQIDMIDTMKKFMTLEEVDKKNKEIEYYAGECIFCPEKEKFRVTIAKEVYTCLNCHAHGDIISFIARLKNITFYESMKWLIEKGVKKRKCAFKRLV